MDLTCLCFLFLLNLIAKSEGYYSNTFIVKSDLNESEVKQLLETNQFRLITKIAPGKFLFKNIGSPQRSKVKSRLNLKPAYHSFKSVSDSFIIEQEQWQPVTLKETITIKDAQWKNMWYMNEQTDTTMGFYQAWSRNITGSGVRIAVVDNGVDYTHTDLAIDRDYGQITDVYENDNDPKPAPGDDLTHATEFSVRKICLNTLSHGTKCAGVIAASRNDECILGAAFDSSLIAIRMIGPFGVLPSGRVQAIRKDVHISSNSWGGREMAYESLSADVAEAFKWGVSELRNKLGVIYVFAGGNGGLEDNCNLDGFVNSIYTIGVNAVTRAMKPPTYGERCTAVLTSAFAGELGASNNICTTDLNNGCVCTFTGTSAATPLAAAALALALQANPFLHWRDVQELVIRSSHMDGLKDAEAKVNGVGRNVSDWYGYGLLNVSDLVILATDWQSLPRQRKCTSDFKIENHTINKGSAIYSFQSVMISNHCFNTTGCVDRVEHVQAEVEFTYSIRGVIELTLQSPMGTVSQLKQVMGLPTRILQAVDTNGYTCLYITGGENPNGTWALTFSVANTIAEGTLVGWSLILHGTGDNCSSDTNDIPIPGETTSTLVTEFTSMLTTPASNVSLNDSMTKSADKQSSDDYFWDIAGPAIGGIGTGALLVGGTVTIRRLYLRRSVEPKPPSESTLAVT